MNRAIPKLELSAFALLGTITIVSVLAAFKTGLSYLGLLPFGLIIIYLGVINFKFLYYLLLFTIPLSIEYSFSSSLATDLPDEPLMLGLMLITIVFVVSNYKSLPVGFFTNFLIVALVAHLFWIFIAAIHSVHFIVSLKVFLAKCWYFSAFCVLTAVIVRTKEDVKKMFWCIYLPLTLLTVQVMARQAIQGFAFDDVNRAMAPFFRNHVSYASILSVFFPFILLARTWYSPTSLTRRILTFSVPLYLVAIYLSYTRTCYIAVALIVPFYLLIRYRLMKPALVIIAIVSSVVIFRLFDHNYFLEYAPVYQETIYHDDFSQHLSSTFEGKDVSSMERVYRWVAATRMFKEHPYFGFGPGNFYPNYLSYTLSDFATYVSDNPERSTAHNYPLLLLTEQGSIGLAIFLFLTAIIFVYGERVYHRMVNADEKRIVMTLLVILGTVYVNLLLSDLLESDKVGPFFFICIALIAAFDIRNRKKLLEPKSE
ncbi:MAG: hypothetical protein JWO06_2846 [Bacteroidota bacterium]|nr:hypothetical protein [Bacteroidota bacterium]